MKVKIASLDIPKCLGLAQPDRAVHADGGGMRVAAVPSGKGNQVNVAVGPGRDRTGLVRAYPGTSFGSGTGEPGGSQLLSPFAGAVLTDGVFVG